MKLARLTDHREARNTRGVVQQHRRDARAETAHYEALSDAGRAGTEILLKVQRAQGETELVKAQMQARDRIDKAYRALERDSEINPDDVEGSFRETTSAILKEEGGRIGSRASRRAWEMQSEAILTDGVIRARTLGMQKRTDRVRANVLEVGTAFEAQALDASTTREVFEQSAQSYMELIERQVQSGVFSKEQAAQYKHKAELALKSGISKRHLTNIDQLGKSGRWGEADAYFKQNYAEITPAQRDKLEGILEQRSMDHQIMQGADNIWNASGRDLETAMEQTAGIEDPERRRKMEARISELSGIQKAGEAQRQKDKYYEGLSTMLNGGSYDDLSPSLLAEMGAGYQQDLLRESERRREQAQRMSNLTAEGRRLAKQQQKEAKAVFELFVAGSPDAQELFATVPAEQWVNHGGIGKRLHQEWEQMDPAERDVLRASMMNDQADALSQDNVQKKRLELIQRMKINPPMVGGEPGIFYGNYGYDPAEFVEEDFKEKTDEPYTAVERQVISLFDDEIRAFFEKRGDVEMSPDDEMQIIRNVYRKVDPEAIDPAIYSMAVELATRAHGANPSNSQIKQAIQDVQKRMRLREARPAARELLEMTGTFSDGG